MVQIEFQENTKMLMVPTNNIIDQKYCRIITRTSQCNSRNSFTKIFFPVKKQVPRLYIVHGSKRILKCSQFL